MDISLVVAMDRNRLIGSGNTLPWHLTADLKHFKKLTLGHTIVMGRRTWESIGKPLPGRTNIVITRQRDYKAPGAVVADSIEAAKEQAGDRAELMIIGGAELYRQMLAEANRVYLTEILGEFDGDTYFPEMNMDEWACTSREDFGKDEKNPHGYSFVVLERIPEALPPNLIQPAL